MHFLFLPLLCFFMSSTFGCKEVPLSGMQQADQILLDTSALGDPDLLGDDMQTVISKLLAQGLSQLFASGEVNFDDFRQKIEEISSNPMYASFLEKASLMDGGECGSCGGDMNSIGLETQISEIGGSCSVDLNKEEL